MAKKRKRYTEQERARVLADMEQNGLTQVAAAKKLGVSEEVAQALGSKRRM